MRPPAAPPRPTASRLAGALERTEIVAAYQPIVSLRSGKLIGAEALARWTDDELGAVPPAAFIPIAENSGAIARLTTAMLRQALATCVALRRDTPDATMSVNVSPCLLADAGLPAMIARLLDEFALPPAALIVEITETAALPAGATTLDTLKALRDLGVGCAIDDFGTGHATLTSLMTLPLTALKIDRGFVAACASSLVAMRIVQATIRLAHDLGLGAVAEGIETEDIAHLLLGMGCAHGQGFYFGRPMTAAALLDGHATPPSRPPPAFSRADAAIARPGLVAAGGAVSVVLE